MRSSRSIRSIFVAGVAATAFAGVCAQASVAAVGGPPSWSWQYWTPDWNKTVFDKRIIKLLPSSMSVGTRKLPTTIAPSIVARFPARSLSMIDYAEPVGNQGGVGSCVSWAIVYGLGGWWANKLHKAGYGGGDWFNPMSVYAPVGGYANVGTWPEPTLDYATWNKPVPAGVGMTKASDYSVNEFDFTHHPTLAEKFAAIPFKFSSWRRLYWVDPTTASSTARGDEVNQIKNELSAGRPVVIAIRLYGDFEDPSWVNNANVYNRRMGSGDLVTTGAHEMLALGYDSNGLRVENSWGTGWGDKGWKTLSWNYIKSDSFIANVADGMH